LYEIYQEPMLVGNVRCVTTKIWTRSRFWAKRCKCQNGSSAHIVAEW